MSSVDGSGSRSPHRSALARLAEELAAKAQAPAVGEYLVPALWTPVDQPAPSRQDVAPRSVHPHRFLHDHVTAIMASGRADLDPCRSLNGQLSPGTGGNWIKDSVIYNVFVRLTTAYDHDGDGVIGMAYPADVTRNAAGIRETGTFLKTIALLGHIRRLGCDVVHLLPVTSIGRDGNKGLLGSPYAIRNPYELDPRQADPLSELGVEEQFQALIEACHRLGIRVIGEFVFRTAARDGDWIREHPDWFYWIDARVADRAPGETDPARVAATYGNPVFDAATLEVIKRKVAADDLTELPAPPEAYRRFFTLPPERGMVAVNAAGQMRGQALNPATGEVVEVKVPGAFADWPPDDTQPPWNDVTYLRMYLDPEPERPRFNYIGYNTIRMYDRALARDELANRPLWDMIREIVPTFQRRYGLDGVMVDMGHAMPKTLMREIVEVARQLDPDFCFLSENFEMKADSVEAGYNAVMGYVWWVEYHRHGLDGLLKHVGEQGVPIPYFGTAENHNTPRAAARPGEERYSRMAFVLNLLLPGAIPFLHSGVELGASHPVNTGLDFTPADLERLRGQSLPLFDIGCYPWDRGHDLVAFMTRVLALRRRFAATLAAPAPASFVRLATGHDDVFAFVRRGPAGQLLVVLNRDLTQAHPARVEPAGLAASGDALLTDELTGVRVTMAGGVVAERLEPGQVRVFVI